MKQTLKRNSFKNALKSGQTQIGLWCSLCSPIAAELVSKAGFDWLLFDTEHSPVEISGLVPLLQAAANSESHSIVRVAWNDTVLIKRALDIGAQTLLIPFVQSVAEAEQAVAACRYPPHGVRGVAGSTRANQFGRVTDYLHHANDEICIIAQIETMQALEKMEEITDVDGIDAIFIGPSDLSASMGYIGNPNHPDVQTAIEQAAHTLGNLGVRSGILATTPEDTRRYLGMGFTFVAAGVDTAILANSVDALNVQINPNA